MIHAIVRLNVVYDLLNSEGWIGNLICYRLGLSALWLCSGVIDCLDQETTGLIISRPILTLSTLLGVHGCLSVDG